MGHTFEYRERIIKAANNIAEAKRMAGKNGFYCLIASDESDQPEVRLINEVAVEINKIYDSMIPEQKPLHL